MISTLSPVQRVCQRIDGLFVVHGWDRVLSGSNAGRGGTSHYEHTTTGMKAVLNPLRFTVTFTTGDKDMAYNLAVKQPEVGQFIITGDRPLTPPTHFPLFNSEYQKKGLEVTVNRDYEIELVLHQLPCDADPIKLTTDELRGLRNEITGVLIYIEESQRLDP